MPVRLIANANATYFLVVLDESGKERPESDGTLLSETVAQQLADRSARVTDVFLTSHGWKGDVPAAIEQYDRWINGMAAMTTDRNEAVRRDSSFTPLTVAIHWPSLPWGDERLPASASGVLAAENAGAVPVDRWVDDYAARIADTPAARAAIREIVESARVATSPDLPPATRAAYQRLFQESGLGIGSKTGHPNADQAGFDPEAIVKEAKSVPLPTAAAPGLLSLQGDIRDALLMPLRQLSFWKMKARAQSIGETAVRPLLAALQLAAPGARFHFMGHSFGCIVASAAVQGTQQSAPLPRPIDSLFLVQGALSLWAFAKDIPYAPGSVGYFHGILERGLVSGPIVTTQSTFDTAVGRFYPLGASVANQVLLDADRKFPRYGGIGAFGIQGVPAVTGMQMAAETVSYRFQQGRVYNLEASRVIKAGAGASGAHSDIVHPEVAHAFWAAVFTSMEVPLSEAASSFELLSLQSMSPDISGLLESNRSFVRDLSPDAPHRQTQVLDQLPAEPQSLPRWVNAELENHARTDPLLCGEWYSLAIDVDNAARPTASASAVLMNDSQLFAPGVDEIVLAVQLDSTDFEMNDTTRMMRLRRRGKSLTKARFDISSRHDGPSSLRATIHKDGNFIQQLELTFDVGAGKAAEAQLTTRGRPLSAAKAIKPRDLSIIIRPDGNGYECTVVGSVITRAHLSISDDLLASAIDAAHDALMAVVTDPGTAGTLPFQSLIDISAADRDGALVILAQAGALLFKKLFDGPGAGADAKALGKLLAMRAKIPGRLLKIQIVAEQTPVPWGLLYVGDASSGTPIDWENFLGFRHIIEQMPLQNTGAVGDPVMVRDNPHFAISTNFNTGIDVAMASHFVADQTTYWTAARSSLEWLRVVSRSTTAEILKALSDSATEDQILYFYCHAKACGLKDKGGPDSSCLEFADAQLTLRDLQLNAPTETQLLGHPLVFINACESAEMSTTFYDGFVPYFMDKGARGVVGTECKTPALFAATWAKEFFSDFLNGTPLGELFLNMRRKFFLEHNNPLGLLYAVHCDGDTQIVSSA